MVRSGTVCCGSYGLLGLVELSYGVLRQLGFGLLGSVQLRYVPAL